MRWQEGGYLAKDVDEENLRVEYALVEEQCATVHYHDSQRGIVVIV